MKTIEEINKIAPYHQLEWQQGYGIWQAGFMEGQKSGAAEQKEIDITTAMWAFWEVVSPYFPDKDIAEEVSDRFRKIMGGIEYGGNQG